MNDKELISYFFKLLFENTPLLNTYLTQAVFKKFRVKREDRKKVSDKIRHIVKKLERHGLIFTKRISKKLYEIYPTPITSQSQKSDPHHKITLDLNRKGHARNPHESPTQAENSDEEGDIKKAYEVIKTPRYARVNPLWFKIAKRYWDENYITNSDIEEITEAFEAWKEDVKEKRLIFMRPDGFIEIKDYVTRFTTKSKAVEIIKTAEEIFKNAFKEYDKAIFLTITLPRVFPLKIAIYVLSFLLHRIKAYIRKQTKEKTPHFRVNEPQNDFYPHIHCIIFNVDYVMSKNELTNYLEKHLENFLSRMGEHYKRTINKRAKDDEIKALNKLGKRILKKYKRYKAKHPRFSGPINWITKVRTEDGTPVFENPPPDVKRFFDKKGTQTDGGKITIWDYLKKYFLKNITSATAEEEGETKEKEKDNLAFYWLLRLPFYTCSNTLRPKKQKRTPQGWVYLCSTYIFNINDAIDYAEWLIEHM